MKIKSYIHCANNEPQWTKRGARATRCGAKVTLYGAGGTPSMSLLPHNIMCVNAHSYIIKCISHGFYNELLIKQIQLLIRCTVCTGRLQTNEIQHSSCTIQKKLTLSLKLKSLFTRKQRMFNQKCNNVYLPN